MKISQEKNTKPLCRVELLAPASGAETGRAAVLCGADALYVGAPRFGARAAAGVSEGDIVGLCDFAHRYGARVYVAMNTLIYEDELADAERMAHRMWKAGADALIVQDMAFLRMDLPSIELHASTQVFNADPQRVHFLGEAGFSRIILERALSLEEIREISAATDVEIEAFVHGAICVGFSGRCYMSRTLGPRSGNRGDCAQLCRLPFNLLDGEGKALVHDKHLLSVRDLDLSAHLEAMIDAGVSSFKIEGRLKDMAYVRNVVSHYRRRLDAVIARRNDLARSSLGVSSVEFTPDPQKTFSRGGTSYYLYGLQRDIASFDTPKAMGEPLGRVVRTGPDWFELDGAALLGAGDGICFTDPAGALTGTSVNRTADGRIWPNRMEGLWPGAKVYRNHDHAFLASATRSRLRRTVPVRGEATVVPEAITLALACGDVTVSVSRPGRFAPADQPRKAEETIRAQLSKTGDTIYTFDKLDIIADSVLFVPASELNALRREAFAALDEARRKTFSRRERKPENRTFPFPETSLSGEENVVNSLAEAFYRDHGVERIVLGHDLLSDLRDYTVMRTRYCLRRENGQCLKEKTAWRGPLRLEHGSHVYELQFDCARCGMDIVYRGSRPKAPR